VRGWPPPLRLRRGRGGACGGCTMGKQSRRAAGDTAAGGIYCQTVQIVWTVMDRVSRRLLPLCWGMI
jgi:hypothetical protein